MYGITAIFCGDLGTGVVEDVLGSGPEGGSDGIVEVSNEVSSFLLLQQVCTWTPTSRTPNFPDAEYSLR